MERVQLWSPHRKGEMIIKDVQVPKPEKKTKEEPKVEQVPEPADEFSRKGYYGVLSVLYALENFDVDSIGAENSFGFDMRAGYRFHPKVAAELLFQNYFGGDLDISGSNFGEYDMFSLTLNAKGFHQIQERIQAFALLGLGYLHVEVDDPLNVGIVETDGGLVGRFGLGVDSYITPNILFNVEVSYFQPFGDLSDLSFVPITFGVQYRF